MRTLYLARHAKSSWKDDTLSDLQRPLNKRGLKNAPEMGRRLKESGVSLDQICCSPANRAFTTAKFLAQAIDFDEKYIIQDDRLYFEGVSSMMRIIQKTKSSCKTLMLVGHNPDMTSLLNKLCGYQTMNIPTCAIATIQFDHGWGKVIDHSGTLIEYDYPKKIR